jgi:DNA polymerase-3 subunit delta
MADAHPVYLLLGPETGSRDEFIRKIRHGIAKRSGEEPEEHRFQGGEDGFGEVETLLRSPSLFQAHVLALFFGAEKIGGKEDGSRLKAYVKEPSQQATLVLISEETRIDKAWAKSFPKAWTTIFWELFEDKKRNWLAQRFRSLGVRIEPDAEEIFLEMVQNDTAQMGAEAERLAQVAEDGVIRADLVETYLYHGKSETVFSLFESAIIGELSHALDILQKLLLGSDANPVQIVGGLLWQLRRLLRYRLLLDAGRTPEAARGEAGIRGKRNSAFHDRAARQVTSGHLHFLIHRATTCDADLRAMPNPTHTLLLERLVYEIAVPPESPGSSERSAPGPRVASSVS